MSTIKVDTIATRTGSGNITASNALLAPSIGGSSDTNTSLSFPGSDVVQLNNGGTARHKFHALNGTSLFEVQASSTGGSGAGGAFLKFKGSNGTPVDIASIDGSMTNGSIGSESGILSFFTMNSGTNSEKVRIFSNGAMAVPNGISLGNGISAAASNLLDDYEEGSHSVTFTNVAFNPTSQSAVYTKIGNVVNYIGTLAFPSTSDTNDINISLPFNSASRNGIGVFLSNGVTNKILFTAGSGTNNMRIYSDNSFSQNSYSNLSGITIYFTITYQTDS